MAKECCDGCAAPDAGAGPGDAPTTTIALVGNPNCGKTSLFNRLTGAHQKVGNWPGVTIDRKEGRYRHGGHDIAVVDLPGVYSLEDTGDEEAIDARIALDYLLTQEPDVVVDVVDASNLERNLFLTTQLLELEIPVVVALTLVDVARRRGVGVDVDELSGRLGCPVVAIDPRRGRGTSRLRDAVAAHGRHASAATPSGPTYPEVLEQAIARRRAAGASTRWTAIERLAAEEADALSEALGEDLDIVLADGRYGFARAAVADAQRRAGRVSATMSERIDGVVLNRWLGIPIFLGIMYLLFMLTINVGGAFVDVFDQLGNALFVHGLGDAISAVGGPDWLRVVVADGAGSGVQTVATFIPIVGLLFIFLSALEDSGYMARAAFVMDRVMRVMGLPGKSFVPLLLGFGCNVPAIMATRTLESRRDRYMTIMMNPFMSCGARLPVYALFAAVFFPAIGQQVVFGLYLMGMAAAVFTGLVLKHTLLRGPSTPFVMELGPYHLPSPGGVVRHAWTRLKGFVFGAGKIIVLMVVVLSVLGSIGTDGTWGHDDGEHSIVGAVSRAATPALAPMGIDEDNWPATVGVVTGVFAKETVVGTLNALYGSLGRGGAATEAQPSVRSEIGAAFATVPANLRTLGDKLLDPLGLRGVGSRRVAAAQGVERGTFTELSRRFDGSAGALAYLLFVLLYTPCAATTGAIRRETTRGWTLFSFAWTTGLAYAVATVFFQLATFGRDPVASTAWIAGVGAVTAVVIGTMRLIGSDRAGAPAPAPTMAAG